MNNHHIPIIVKLLIQLIAIVCIVFVLLPSIIKRATVVAIKEQMPILLKEYYDNNAPTIYEETSDETKN